MKLLVFLERKLTITKIILLPAFIGLVPFIIGALFFPENSTYMEFSAFFGLFIGGFIGLLMIHYKQVPSLFTGPIDPKLAVFIGIVTTFGCWFNLILFIMNYLFK